MPDNPILIIYIGGVYLFATLFGYSLLAKKHQMMQLINTIADSAPWPRWGTYLLMAVMYTFGWPFTLASLIAFFIISARK